MGDKIPIDDGVTLQVKFPSSPSQAYILKNGAVIGETGKKVLTFTTTEPGVYRVEAYHQFLGRRRGWIFSNPIYIV
jgi:hypothetical protein